jgi:hypothetical protein
VRDENVIAVKRGAQARVHRFAIHWRSGGSPPWSCTAAPLPVAVQHKVVGGLDFRDGNSSGAGSPPAKEMTSGFSVSFNSSLISDALVCAILLANLYSMAG